jgi:hypothetical protein
MISKYFYTTIYGYSGSESLVRNAKRYINSRRLKKSETNPIIYYHFLNCYLHQKDKRHTISVIRLGKSKGDIL